MWYDFKFILLGKFSCAYKLLTLTSVYKVGKIPSGVPHDFEKHHNKQKPTKIHHGELAPTNVHSLTEGVYIYTLEWRKHSVAAYEAWNAAVCHADLELQMNYQLMK